MIIPSEVLISRILGLDVGDARIGLALSDPLRILASPLKILVRQNTPADIQSILDIALKNDVGLMVVGLPVNMDGTMGGQVEKVREFVKELRLGTKLPIELKDERLTTVQAKEYMQSSRKSRRHTRFDAAAAAIILQSYLDNNLLPKEISEDHPPES